MGAVEALTDATFDEAIAASAEPVVVDFWADWCGPCKPLGELLEQVAVDHAGKVRVLKVDIEDAPKAVQRHDVMTLPTLIVFEGGKPVKRFVGGMGRTALLEALADYL